MWEIGHATSSSERTSGLTERCRDILTSGHSRYVTVFIAQKCDPQSQKEQLQGGAKAIMELCDLETLNAQACCMQKKQDEALHQKDETIDRYRRQLSASLEREKNLEQKMMQQKLEWQKNWEDIKAKHYLNNEQLIQELAMAREKADAELVETKQQLQDLTVLLHCVKQERDQALQGAFPSVGSLVSEEMERLQDQNSRLQAVVSQMRMQMEELSQFTSPLYQHLEAPATFTTPTANAKNKGRSALKKQDVQPLESNLTNAIDKQVLNPASMCPCGHVPSAKRECFQLYSRLKLAVSCIVHLNRDKQQLIEMCNRLRAQISTAEVHCPMKAHLKKELEVEKTEVQSVSAAEQVPNTTQRPQFYSGVFSAQRSPEESLPSLRELWALLDHGPSEAGADLGRADVSELIADENQMKMQGVSAPLHSQSTAKHLQRRSCSKGPLKTTSRFAITKIRNYNMKD